MNKQSLSKAQLKLFIANEYNKCKKNPIYFLENYCKVLTEADGPQPFNMYEFQKEKCLKRFLKHRDIVIVKGRQTGVSTIIAGYALWLCIFRPFFSVVIISKDKEAAQGVVKKVQIMIDYMPKWLHPKQTTLNKESLAFANGSEIKAFASTSEAGRSFSPKLLIFDEGAFIEKAKKIYTAARPGLSKTKGQFITISTPNGMNWFSNIYHNAPENGFHAEKIMWYEMPDRDEQWAIEEEKKIGKKEFAQEYCCDFQQSGDTVIEPEDITRMEENMITEPIRKEKVFNDDGDQLMPKEDFWIWEDYDPNYTYVISADVSRGDRDDNSAFHVFKVPSPEQISNGENVSQVAEYYGRTPTDEFGQILDIVGRRYGDALVIVENTGGLGIASLNVLIRKDYPNLYYADSASKQISIYQDQNTKELNSVPGFATSPANRHRVLPAAIEKMWRRGMVEIHSKRTINEAWTWIWKNGKAIHEDDCHDDLIMSLAIFSHIYDTSLKEEGIALENWNKALDAIVGQGEAQREKMEKLMQIKRETESKNPWKFVYQEDVMGNNDEVWDLRELLR